jgi:CheY-like chemotaxis protein
MRDVSENDQACRAASPSGCRVLFVQNQVASHRSLWQLLQRDGHSVVPALTVAAALEFLKTFDPQCVVLDLVLPDGRGVEVLKQLRRSASDIRVAILCTEQNSAEAADAARAYGPASCFRKPVDADALLRWVRSGPRVVVRQIDRVVAAQFGRVA